MEKELWVVYFVSANYCGAGEHCMVWASSEDEAMEAAADYANEYYYEQDYSQFCEENGIEQDDYTDEECWASVVSATPLNEDSEEMSRVRGYLLDEIQAMFYPIVNFK